MNPLGLNNQSGPNLILVKTALDKLVADEMKIPAAAGKGTATDPIIFSQDVARNFAVVASVEGGGGYFQQTNQDIITARTANISAASPKTIQVFQFLDNLPISRTFMDDQQQSAVAKAVKQRYQAWISTQERNAYLVYGNGFTGSTSNSTTIDNVPLFSNSHLNENGDTVDNYETGVLSDSNLNVLVNSLRTQINQGGTIVGYEPAFLLGASLLDHDMRIVAKSVLRSGSGNNDLNYYSELYPGMQVKFSPFLDAVSTTAFFIGTRGHDVYRYEREGYSTTLVPWQTDVNDMYQYKMRAREVVDALSYVGVCGSDGSVSS